MGEMELFFKCNKENRENREMPVCSTLKDENGNVVMWQIRHITTEENEDIRQECMEEKGGKYRLNVNKYLSKITAMSVVYPNLYDADLQDSYGKKTPESLLKAIVDCPGEYDSLVSFVQEINGFTSLREDIEKAKNNKRGRFSSQLCLLLLAQAWNIALSVYDNEPKRKGFCYRSNRFET